ncbi:coiled-coil domain-containing protein 97 [Anopheles maculipalpis]|uniref:coiled-coil domain-containing protein 97 n=1 Tax=Anopheles maculipalpis TaxID=1496333 RepID=UPI0021594BAA|nr:coiled-coil domain-containing protein 97 [Anopheles maculipalpis]
MGTFPKTATGGDGGSLAVTSPPPAPVIESDIFDHISANPQVFYKSQQISDPELTESEKRTILRDVLNKSHCTFLSRFGLFMRDDHLRYFEQDEQTLAYSPDERYEIDHHLERIRKLRNGGRAIEVRNRRYAALQRMCDDGTYFSETEMMQRDPLLYDQLVGQYLTEQEKHARDATPLEPRSVVGILLKQIDKDQAEKDLQQQRQVEAQLDGEPSRPNSPSFPRAQWGNFDEEEEARVAALKSRSKQTRRHAIPAAQLMTAGERNLLRDVFVGIMHARFLAGEDKEFDYTEIDDSSAYDDLDTVDHDEQEKYFNRDDESDAGEDAGMHIETGEEDESEDDLDIYMRHLNRHLEQQQKMAAEDAAKPTVSTMDRDPDCEYDSDD